MLKTIRYRLCYSLLLFALVSQFSCQSSDEAYSIDQLGQLSLKVELDSDQVDVVTKGDEEEDYSDYSIRVLKAGEVYASYIYGEMAETVNLKAGEYDLKAYWGVNAPVAFDSPYYEGVVPFEVKQAELVTVTVPCSMANAQITFSFSELFEKVFTDYSVRVTNAYYDTAADPFYFTKGEERSVNVMAEDIYLSLVLQRYDGEMFTYALETITDVEGGNNYLVNLDASYEDDATITVSIDETTNDISESYEIDESWLVKNAPMITGTKSSGSTVKSIYQFPTIGSFIATVTSDAEIESLKLSSSSDDFAAIGLGSEVELVGISDSDLATLETFGITLDRAITSGQNGVRFTKILESLSVGEHQFSLSVTDIYGQEASYSVTFDIVDDLTVNLSEPADGDVWATKAYLTGVTYSDFTDIDINTYPEIEYQMRVSGGDWEAISGASSFQMSNLTPATTYQYRVGLAGHYSNEVSFTTESALQHGNSSFDDGWYSDNVYYNQYSGLFIKFGVNIVEWFVKKSSSATGYWATNNPTTTSQSSGTSCNYTGYSGTKSTTTKVSGTYGARMATVGWGSGNTFLNTMTGVIIYNVTCGEIRSAENGASDSDGIPFASRPTSLKFYYTYAPRNSNSMEAYIILENRDSGTVEIGRGSFTSGTTVSSYTAKTIDVTYDANYSSLKATHIRLIFRSAASSGLDDDDVTYYKGSSGSTDGYDDSYYEGSVLQIDDVELIY